MSGPSDGAGRSAADTTARLLARAQAGDGDAANDLFTRHMADLSRWARGRLPAWARDLTDTRDLVQDAVLETFRHVRGFEWRGKGALRAYLRQALLNRLRNEIRRLSRRPTIEGLGSEPPAEATSPLEAAIRHEQQRRYNAALRRLNSADRELVLARLERGLTYEEIARAYGKPSWNAARMAVARALVRLAAELTDVG